jgi:hypothetical protein
MSWSSNVCKFRTSRRSGADYPVTRRNTAEVQLSKYILFVSIIMQLESNTPLDLTINGDTWSVLCFVEARSPNHKTNYTAVHLLHPIYSNFTHWWFTIVPYVLGHNFIPQCLYGATDYLMMDLNGPKHVIDSYINWIIKTMHLLDFICNNIKATIPQNT